MDNIEKQFVRVGDINLHVVTDGDADGEPIMLLHGFPEFWYGWRKQITFLAEQGYRVIVPDQRGYNLSDKPHDISYYDIDNLAQDVVNLADAFGYDKINLVGHDWGAAVAWWVATLFPDRLKKLIILNVPHPIVMAETGLQGNIAQLMKSWYMGFFQLPFIPETLASLDDYKLMGQGMLNSGNPNSFTEDDIKQYRRAWSQPNAMKSMINWYRALRIKAFDDSYRQQRQVKIVTPTLMLWGEKDPFLGKELAQPSIEMCLDGELVFFPNATHWLQHDEADAVNEEIHNFVSQAVTEAEG